MNAPVLTYRLTPSKPRIFEDLAMVCVMRDVITDDGTEVAEGTQGTVVGIWADGAAYEVEFEEGLATIAATALRAI